jgi:hypothetical protein
MCLRRKIDESIRLLGELRNYIFIEYVAVGERKPRIVGAVGEVFEISGVRQRIKYMYFVLWMLGQDQANEVASDKAGTAGND